MALGSGEEILSWEIKQGDCLAVLKTMAGESVHCVVTSPPYWGLRDYGVEGQLGLEKTPEEYIAKMVAVFREVKRVLRSDGTLWLNIGDSYAGSWGNYVAPGSTSAKAMDKRRKDRYGIFRPHAADSPGMKPKDLVGIPWLLAFALRADGWWLRSDIIWHKPNPMPESVSDRPTKAHEYLFLLTKSSHYYYDAEAIKEIALDPEDDARRLSQVQADHKSFPDHGTHNGLRGKGGKNAFRGQGHNRFADNGRANRNGRDLKEVGVGLFRNKRSVWSVATSPFPEAHFATFPPKLIEPCILAGTSERGCCAQCGAPLERKTEPSAEYAKHLGKAVHNHEGDLVRGMRFDKKTNSERVTKGWEATCDCQVAEIKTGAPEAQKIFRAPCIVLDPFSGAGTTGLVTRRLQRSYIGIELNPEYIAMSERRITDDQPLFNTVTA